MASRMPGPSGTDNSLLHALIDKEYKAINWAIDTFHDLAQLVEKARHSHHETHPTHHARNATPAPTGAHRPVAGTPKKKLPTHAPKKPRKLDYLERAFQRAIALGWRPHFEKAAKNFNFEPEILWGIGYQETRLNPYWLKHVGTADHHGYGLMQVDDRSFPTWVAAGNWKDAKKCIWKGAEVLDGKRTEILDHVKKDVKLKGKDGQWHSVEGKEIQGAALLQAAIADYNCGLWGYYNYSKDRDVDSFTTGKAYSKGVLDYSKRFAKLLAQADHH